MTDNTCRISDCEKAHGGTTKGMCWMHYYRERRHGHPLVTKISPETATMQERFYFIGWEVTDAGCWEWSGARNSSGYGQIGTTHKRFYAHRVSYELHTRDYLLSDRIHGDLVMHMCDNPPCVNPSHLKRGSHQDNMADMARKGRGRNSNSHYATMRG